MPLSEYPGGGKLYKPKIKHHEETFTYYFFGFICDPYLGVSR